MRERGDYIVVDRSWKDGYTFDENIEKTLVSNLNSYSDNSTFQQVFEICC